MADTSPSLSGEVAKPRRWNFLGGIKSASIPNRIAGLDELRGIAVLVVMIAHGAGFSGFIPGWAAAYGSQGVYLFFAISGYLITRILLDAGAKEEPLSTFYVRRFLRIWPLMLAALLFSALAYPGTRDAVAYNLILMNNYAMAAGIEPAFRTDVMWSLAIEEQFYLVWPFAVALAGRKWLPYLIAPIICVGFLFDSGVLDSGGLIAGRTTQGDMQYIALGAAIALGRPGLVAAVVGVLSFAATFAVIKGASSFNFIWYGIALASFAATFITVHVAPLIRFPPLAHLGRLCYGLYLIHFFVAEYVSHAMPAGPASFGVYIAISYAFALASLFLFEAPILNTRRIFERSTKARSALALVVAVMVIGALAFVASNGRKPANLVDRKEQLLTCAGAFQSLGGENSQWRDDLNGIMAKLEAEGMEFALRVEGTQTAAEGWATRSEEARVQYAEMCRAKHQR